MKKEITASEWLEIVSNTAHEAAMALHDNKITMDEALSIGFKLITDIVNAYNN